MINRWLMHSLDLPTHSADCSLSFHSSLLPPFSLRRLPGSLFALIVVIIVPHYYYPFSPLLVPPSFMLIMLILAQSSDKPGALFRLVIVSSPVCSSVSPFTDRFQSSGSNGNNIFIRTSLDSVLTNQLPVDRWHADISFSFAINRTNFSHRFKAGDTFGYSIFQWSLPIWCTCSIAFRQTCKWNHLLSFPLSLSLNLFFVLSWIWPRARFDRGRFVNLTTWRRPQQLIRPVHLRNGWLSSPSSTLIVSTAG